MKKVITETEKSTLFNEWLKEQSMPDFKTKEERQRWWVDKVIEFDQLTKDDHDIV